MVYNKKQQHDTQSHPKALGKHVYTANDDKENKKAFPVDIKFHDCKVTQSRENKQIHLCFSKILSHL
jgi:hypothetical protein